VILVLAICWTLSGCKMANWQQAGYGPGGVVPDAGQFPGGPPAAIDLGNPSGESDVFGNDSAPELSEPRTFESQRPVVPPARSNPTRDVPDSNVPDAQDNGLSAPQANQTPAGNAPRRLYIPPLWGPLRLGEGTRTPFPEGRWKPPANPPVANRDENPERSDASQPPDASQPLPLTKKVEPRGSYEFPWRRPEDVLNTSPETASPNDSFDLPPLVKRDSPEKSGTPEETETGPELPVLESPLLAEAVPEFEVDLPPSILVGEATAIAVRIAAPEGESFRDLKLIVTPGSGLVLTSAANEAQLTLDCPELMSGQLRKLTFDLQAVSSGTHDFTLSLKRGEKELVWKKLSLTAQPRQLMTELIGPDRKPVNGRAEFTFKIENVSQEALGPIEAILESDSTLVPMEASAGAEQKPGQLVWSFPVLQPGELILLQAEYACPVETGSTLVSAYVSIEDGPAQVRQSSLAVNKAAGTLQVELLDRNDLSTVEREMTGVVRVTNLGLQPVRDLKVDLELPELLGFAQVTANVGSESVEIEQEVTDGTYTFTLPSELASEQTVDIAITFDTLKAGDGTLQVNATAAGIATPVSASEPFTVTP
jgi:hypothetical protein